MSEKDSLTEYQGLTSADVEKLTAEGKANSGASVSTKSVPEIVKTHVFTLFNIVNLVLALLVLTTGELRNMLFVFVAVLNTLVSVVQEIRAKKLVDKLAILAARDVRVVRDGKETAVPSAQIVEGDLILLAHGDQVPADAVVISGTLYMHEGLLTGESVPVEHRKGEELLSGSFVDSGSCRAKIVRVGADSFANRMTDEVKVAKQVSSEIMRSLDLIIELVTVLLLPIGILLFFRSFMADHNYSVAILSTVAALVGMIPQGLILLTSSVLAISTMRLARKSVLVQQMYCIEQLARVDVLCLDKTGTITTGGMTVDSIQGFTPDDTERACIIAATVSESSRDDANSTTAALLDYAQREKIKPAEIARTIPFSSARKYSGCVTKDGESFVLGAAQFVLKDAWVEIEDRLRSFAADERILVIATADGFAEDDSIIGEAHVVGFVAITDEIRPTAKATMQYFTEQHVALRVISGDDPATVSAVAINAGVPGADRYVDASTLLSEADLAEAVRKTVVFGRVTPDQKRSLVHVLQSQGHSVAMTGDGVNDVLALHDADCSVAMASGSDAARNVADIVLVDDDFAHMPEVVAEGRRSINNLQRSASLFLVKTVWTVFVALFSIIFPPFPMQPIQMSLISALTIGYPSFVLALEPNKEKIKGRFLENVLLKSLPASLAISIAIAANAIVGRILGIPNEQLSVISTMLVFFIGTVFIARIGHPLTKLRIALIISVVIGMLLCILAASQFFLFEPLSVTSWILMLVDGGLSTALFFWYYDDIHKNGKLVKRFVNFIEKFGDSHGRRNENKQHSGSKDSRKPQGGKPKSQVRVPLKNSGDR